MSLLLRSINISVKRHIYSPFLSFIISMNLHLHSLGLQSVLGLGLRYLRTSLRFASHEVLLETGVNEMI